MRVVSTCEHCRLLGIPDSGTAGWIVHTSVDEAIRYQIPKASRAELTMALVHMELADDSRVSLRKRLVTALRARLKADDATTKSTKSAKEAS